MLENQQSSLRYPFVMTGTLIGLGIGLLFGYPASGIFMGQGLGFIASAATPHVFSKRWWPFLGIIYLLIGIGIIYTPYIYIHSNFWVGVAITLMGIGFFLRVYRRNK